MDPLGEGCEEEVLTPGPGVFTVGAAGGQTWRCSLFKSGAVACLVLAPWCGWTESNRRNHFGRVVFCH